MEILDQVSGILEQDDYAVYRRGEPQSSLEFEDANLFGVVQVFDTVDNLLRGWKDIQSAFLDRHQTKFQTARDKAWNAYVVLLTADIPGDTADRLTDIEEDFYAARKIVGSSLEGRGSIRNALSPLLKLRSAAVIASTPPEQRLQQLESLSQKVRDLLTEGAAPEQFATHFLETS